MLHQKNCKKKNKGNKEQLVPQKLIVPPKIIIPAHANPITHVNPAVYVKPAPYVKPVAKFSTHVKAVEPIDCRNRLFKLMTRVIPETLEFTEEAWVKINAYINVVGNLEITGLGRIEDGLITDVIILPQLVEPAHAECGETAIGDFLMSLSDEERPLWTLDWHSHVNMGVFASPEDKGNYLIMNELRDNNGFPYMIINKKQDICCAFYANASTTPKIEVYLPDNITMSEDEFDELYAQCEDDVIEHCTELYKVYDKVEPIEGAANTIPAYLHNTDIHYGSYYPYQGESQY